MMTLSNLQVLFGRTVATPGKFGEQVGRPAFNFGQLQLDSNSWGSSQILKHQ